MVFSFFNKQRTDKSLTLLVDIGSASVGAALVELVPGKAPHMVMTTRENISFQEELSSAKFVIAMNHALERSLKTVQRKIKGRGAPGHIFCTLSSPWFMLKTRHITSEAGKDFVVTEKEIDALVRTDIDRLGEELKGVLPESDIAIIERNIIQTKLNGYEIKNPYGQRTRNIEIVAMIGLSSKKVVAGIERRIGQVFHTESVSFSSFPVVAFSALRDMFPQENDFLFVDITGEATEISLIAHDVLRGSSSFPRGKNFFVRDISGAFKTPHEAAMTLLNMFLHDMLDAKKKALLEGLMQTARTEWVRRFEKTLGALAKEASVPQKIFFSSDNDVAGFFNDILRQVKQSPGADTTFEVHFLDQEIVSKFVTSESEVVRDPFLTLEALLVNKIKI